MAYDESLAAAIRRELAALPAAHEVREVRMFGGLAFLVDDRMVACASGREGALLVRVQPDDAALLARPGARRGEMGGGRQMSPGWVAVDRGAVATPEDLRFWLDAALRHHRDGT